MDFNRIEALLAAWQGGTFFVGFSGGADSCALLLLAARFAAPYRIAVVAVHCEHGIRGTASLADAEYCRQFAARRGIPFRLLPLQVPANRRGGESLEAAARRLRLEAFRSLLAGRQQAALLLGHHADDAVENLFLRLLRGGNVSSLTNLRPFRVVGGIPILRPLLHISRREIEQFLLQNGITDWRRDETNAASVFLRNYWRLKVLPALYRRFPPARRGFQRALEALECDAIYLEERAAEAYREIAGEAATPLAFWQQLHPALRGRVLRLFLSARLHRDFIPPAALLQRLSTSLAQPAPCTIPLNGQVRLRLAYGQLTVETPPAGMPPETIVWSWRQVRQISWHNCRFEVQLLTATPPLPLPPDQALFDAARLPDQLLLTTRRPGDRLTDFNGRRLKVKKLLIDAKIPHAKRDGLPLLRTEREIIWLPGLRHSNFAGTDASTRLFALFRYF
ncbi:tRNA lysidine(34) synthetase TilS [Victivallis sp. Marseille-Q1083]|uniref:tRNA lysidine(34) synthetase TilS n=1 Tax=Victivallis sp. Marseille-Q1083 TaxID=2717288 RepID=UPI00158EAD75|nr:tRNA lysidine(34) synthetase TilS [Victivallis sp. Marseille-Q1083]